jgi:hypothetical protein
VSEACPELGRGGDLFAVGPLGEAAAAPAPEDFPLSAGADVADVDPFPVIEQVAAIVAATPIAPAETLAAWRNPALAAFIDRRAELQAKHGERAVTDPARPPALIAHDLKERACAILDRLTGRPSREQAELALGTLATIGALALALHDRLSADLSTSN